MRRHSRLLATAGLAAILALSFGGVARAQHGGGHVGGGHMGGFGGHMGGFGGFGGMSGIGRGIPGGLGGGFGGVGGVHRGLPGGMGGFGGVNMGGFGGHVGGMSGGRIGGLNGLPGGVRFGNPGFSGGHGYYSGRGPGWGGHFVGPAGGWRGGGWRGTNLGWGGSGLGWGVGRAGWGSGQLGFGGFGPRWGYGYRGLNGLGWGYGGLGLRYGGLGWGLGGLGLGYGGLGWGLGGLGWGVSNLGWWGYPGWGLGWGYGNLGWGLGGIGLSSWSWPMLYDWGYSSYLNPYYMGANSVYDYSRPLSPRFDAAISAATKAASPAADLFEKARVAFEEGLYTAALDYADQAVEKRPDDPTLHEFRALALFALKRYDEAAAALYPVLSVGPGWDWPTLISLYGNSTKVYTGQIRALEDYIRANPESAQANFLLAYHYLTQGHGEAALGRLRVVTELKPDDKLSAELLKQLEKAKREALAKDGGEPMRADADANPVAGSGLFADVPAPKAKEKPPAEAPAVAAREGSLDGTWTAKPSNDSTITLDLTKKGKFAWKVVDGQGKPRSFEGVRATGNGLLTLVRDGDPPQPPLVGRVSWTDDDHFTFKLVGGGEDDPGLAFAREK